jgi:enterochelin esterase-like enzyme
VLEPQSTALFVLLMLIFGALTWWMLVTRQPALRVLAACLAFTPAMLFGVMAVNKYYGYYQTWGAAIADLTNQGTGAAPSVPVNLAAGSQLDRLDGSTIYLRQAQVFGYTLRLNVTGQRSGITRAVYVYLPPQYFWSSYKPYRFPVVELIHGQPGEPQDWINVVGVTATLDHLVIQHLAQPVVLVMPDANGGENVSLQCLNQAGGPQDLTYLAEDLPDQIAHIVRVQPPGPAWGLAGYSEGGFCAANMALQFPGRYGFAGSLSGYFKPFDNQLAHPIRRVNPFGGSRVLQLENTPLDEIAMLRPGVPMPQFWLGAGQDDRLATAGAEIFRQELQLRQADVPLTLTPGGGHTMTTWRAEVPPMLDWMTQGLAQVVQKEATAQSRKASVLAAQRARGRARSAPNHHAPIPHVPIRHVPVQHGPVQHAPIRQKSASPSPSHTEVS